ncbi:MAG: hypothetical protein KGL74_12805 [Elusimicrobia bacterium]|nr:hypothetical protein [Elusimicrobiota bacterium]
MTSPRTRAASAAFLGLALGLGGVSACRRSDSRGPDDYRLAVRRRAGSDEFPAALSAARRWAELPGLTPAQVAEALCAGAEVRAMTGDAAGAADDFRKALALHPGDARALIGLARALRETPEDALPFADRAVDAAATLRDRAAAGRLAAEIRLDLGDAAGARARLETALTLAPDDLEARRDMVRAKRSRPMDAAVDAARADQAAGRVPLWSRPDAYRLCARIWLELKDYPRAEADLGRALALDPDDLDALELLVQLKREAPRGTSAAAAAPPAPAADAALSENEVQAALRADPLDLDALRRLIALRRSQGRAKEAGELARRFTDAVESAPVWQQAAAYHLITRVWLDLGNHPMARQTLWKARDMDPRSLATGLLGKEMKEPGPTAEDAVTTIVRARADLREASRR